ncbi:peptidase M24 [Desarmillaria tabescens]|uniref:Peptidase M24 n=1 Tax=Armillaria tabescens TaxID=1929756 RepID=A0AA39N5T6_ARMTA|nr:peptidase M24 [Desarmillaria tabescens]KAK0458494.1 peptidase M24 [Desarmillaria tabescens]
MGSEGKVEASPPPQAKRRGWYLLCLALVVACLIVYPYPSRLHSKVSTLGETLTALNASAYIAEPGASALYYANVSTSHWHLSERPLLLIVDASAQITVLTPKFEGTRARLLHIPSDVKWVEWAEDEVPIRHFIVDGLRTAFPKATVTAAPTEIRQLRERKSEGELALLKCANEVRVLSPTHVILIARALADAGLKDGGCLTLFGAAQIASLRPEDFALFDCTASLHGYWSDVTRTLALPVSTIPDIHLQIWNFVHSAQNIAFGTAHAGVVAKRVDEAPRLFLGLAGIHEDPYLNGGSEVILQTGHTFSDEPGVYIEGKIGVRLEDCFYIAQNGSAVYLTAGVGGPASSPWKP